jgi:hypothetical protein
VTIITGKMYGSEQNQLDFNDIESFSLLYNCLWSSGEDTSKYVLD